MEPINGELTDPVPDDEAERKEAKLLNKLQRKGDTRTLDPWERCRALTDMLEDCNELAGMADRKTRFALIIMAALNTGNVLAFIRPEVVFGGGGAGRTLLSAYFAVYASLSLFFFLQAILALKPRTSTILGRIEAAGSSVTAFLGVRFAGDVVALGADEYHNSWTETQVGYLSREIAMQVQLRARVNLAKFRAVERVYNGLLTLVALTAALVTSAVYQGLAD